MSELKDKQGCAILALEVVPINLIFAEKFYPKIYFTRICSLFQQGNYALLLIYQQKMAGNL